LSCPFSDAECFWVGPGAPAIHAPTYAGWATGGAAAGGVEVYGVGANTALQSQTLVTGTSPTSPWVVNQGSPCALPVLDDDASAAPDGTTTADHVGLPACSGTGYSQIYQGFTATDASWTWSIWVKKISGTATTLPVRLETGSVSVAAQNCPVSSTWTRCTGTGTLAAGTRYMIVGVDTSRGQSTEGGVFAVWGAQVTATATPMPYRATTGAAYSGAAGTATTLTVPVTLTDPARWAVGATLAHAEPTGAQTMMLALGTSAAANSVNLFEYTDSKFYFDIYDGAASQKRASGSHGLTGTSPYSVLAGWDGSQILRVNGVGLTLTTSGAGTGIFSTMPTTLLIGSNSAGSQFNGLVSRVVQCKRAGGCR
jgi:hypothetical protein